MLNVVKLAVSLSQMDRSAAMLFEGCGLGYMRDRGVLSLPEGCG